MSRAIEMKAGTLQLPEILSLEDLAKALRLKNERAAKRLLGKFPIPRTAIGRKVYVLRSALLKFLEEQQETPSPSDGVVGVLDELKRKKRSSVTSVLQSRRRSM